QPVLRGFAPESAFPGEADAARGAVIVHVHRYRRQTFAEGDSFLECFLDFLVIERVRRAVDQSAPVGDGDAAPVPEELDDARGAAFPSGKGPFLADRARMREELLGDLALLVVPLFAHRILAGLRDKGL